MNILSIVLLSLIGWVQPAPTNPVQTAFLEFEEQGTFGEAFEEVRVTFRIALDEEYTLSQIRCMIVAEEGAPVLFDQWVNLNGSGNEDVVVSTDSNTGDTLIDIGILEMPYVFRATVTAKSTTGEDYPNVNAI